MGPRPRHDRRAAAPLPATLLGAALLTLTVSGCSALEFGPEARNGIVFYVPGAGNYDLGDFALRDVLKKKGYRGQVARLPWTYSYNVAIDQTVRDFARLASKRLAAAIQEYLDIYPDQDVNIVGLSAGTGIAVWALESLRPEYKVNNVVLLSGSISHDYDVSWALERMNGKIYNFYSPIDAVLVGPMKVFGTIDAKYLTDGAGAVGLHPPKPTDRVVNTEWRRDFIRYGYFGGHFDAASPAFIEAYIAQHLIPGGDSVSSTAHATHRDRAARAVAGD